MREYSKALEALQIASSADTTNAHTGEIQSQETKTQQALFSQRAGETEEQTLERAMKDPEVAVCAVAMSTMTTTLTELLRRES
jgi:stress-induced-phosphoprotein 1